MVVLGGMAVRGNNLARAEDALAVGTFAECPSSLNAVRAPSAGTCQEATHVGVYRGTSPIRMLKAMRLPL